MESRSWSSRLARPAAPALVLGAGAALAWSTGGPLAAVRAPGPAQFEDLLALTAGLAAWSVLGWLATALLLSLLSGLRPQVGALDRLARAITPHAVRRLAVLLLGVGLVGAVVALPAQAGPVAVATAEPAQATPGPGPPARSLGRWTPDRPAAVPSAAPGDEPLALLVSRPHRERAVTDDVVVRRGDTLWDIAARALRPHASAAQIAAGWPRWHAANRSVIGPDPDLIRPGQRLRPPGA